MWLVLVRLNFSIPCDFTMCKENIARKFRSNWMAMNCEWQMEDIGRQQKKKKKKNNIAYLNFAFYAQHLDTQAKRSAFSLSLSLVKTIKINFSHTISHKIRANEVFEAVKNGNQCSWSFIDQYIQTQIGWDWFENLKRMYIDWVCLIARALFLCLSFSCIGSFPFLIPISLFFTGFWLWRVERELEP